MHKRLYNFLNEHSILFSNQFGFRKNNSTSTALNQISEKIKESIDKMEHYGIRNTALEWFKSYLSNRKQYVYSNGESIQLKDITCGIPQWSVLGPLLLIYINDLPNI